MTLNSETGAPGEPAMQDVMSHGTPNSVIQPDQIHLFAFDPVDGQLAMAQGMEGLLGLINEADLRAAFLARLSEADRATLLLILDRRSGSPQPFDMELRLTPSDGAVTALQLRGLESRSHGVVGAMINRTPQPAGTLLGDEGDQQILASVTAVLDAIPQMVWSTRPDGFHDYYNAGWYEFTGMPLGSTDGEAWNGMFHPEDQQRAWDRWSQSLRTGDPYEIEYRLRHHSGQYHWVLGRALPIRNEAGAIIRWYGTCTDINETKSAAEYVELLSQELSHRIKNIFAIIHSLIGLSGRRAPESQAFARNLQARIQALGRAHDLARPHSELSRPTGGNVTLHTLAREVLRPYLAMDDGRIEITGADIAVDDAAATPFALILHELATNAKKYGALSTETGSVRIATSCDDRTCTIIWAELGGPRVRHEPENVGFGTKLVSVSAEAHLNGTIRRDWNESGLSVTLTCPRSSLVRS